MGGKETGSIEPWEDQTNDDVKRNLEIYIFLFWKTRTIKGELCIEVLKNTRCQKLSARCIFVQRKLRYYIARNHEMKEDTG